MKYNIGDIVRIKTNQQESYIILATKKQILNNSYLNQIEKKLVVKNINRIAENDLFTQKGFDYTIAKIKTIINEEFVLHEEFIYVFEEDLE